MEWLTSTGTFEPRGGDWPRCLVVIVVFSETAQSLLLFLISYSLIILWKIRRSQLDYPWPWVILLLAVFLGVEGLTHVYQALAFYWPAYYLFAAVRIAGVIISLCVATVFPWWIIRLSHTSTVNQTPRTASAESAREVEHLSNEVGHLKAQLKTTNDGLIYYQRSARRVSKIIESMQEDMSEEVKNKFKEVRELLSQVPDSDVK